MCVWNLHDAFGVGGDPDFHINVDGRLHHCAGDLRRCLKDNPGDPDTPTAPGPPTGWAGAPSDLREDQLPYHHGHNHALHNDCNSTGIAE